MACPGSASPVGDFYGGDNPNPRSIPCSMFISVLSRWSIGNNRRVADGDEETACRMRLRSTSSGRSAFSYDAAGQQSYRAEAPCKSGRQPPPVTPGVPARG